VSKNSFFEVKGLVVGGAAATAAGAERGFEREEVERRERRALEGDGTVKGMEEVVELLLPSSSAAFGMWRATLLDVKDAAVDKMAL